MHFLRLFIIHLLKNRSKKINISINLKIIDIII